jgi:4-hydroxy-tetrahydrodipicolinate synthase
MNYRRSEAKEAARAQFRGVWAAIATPFHADGSLDESGLRSNMRHFTGSLGVAGIFCAGTMGEFWALTKEERKRVVEIVVEEARGKCKVIAHTGHHSPDETVDLTRHAQEVGADFAVVINPYYPVSGEQAIYEWFKAVVSKVDIGVWMFDTAFSGLSLSARLTARIAEFEKLCGDKIVLSHPSETEYLTLMRDYGMRVHMSSAAPFLMQTASWKPMHEYSELGLAGRFDEAKKVRDSFEPLREVHEKWMREPWLKHQLIPIAYLKAWTEMLGMAAGPVRAPLLQITDAERATLRADLEGCGLLARVPAARA